VSAPGPLAGRVALVTGASRGIGRAIALALAADGAAVAVNYRRDEESAKRTAADIAAAGGTVALYRASVESPDEDAAMVEAVRADLGDVDLLVNNAGASSRGRPVADTEVDDLERTIAVMAFGSHHLCRLVLPGMRGRPRGDIVFVSSQSAVQHNPFGAPYNMAKAAQESLAFTLAQEEARHGIRVNVVAAGLVDTDLGRKVARAAARVEDIHDLDARFALGRVCTPEDIAGAVRFLVSPAAEQITGQRVAVDAGGLH
jgi:NAD(P)-dependent dehydrogenase (short-subunit alcohol dehydrogenase family)